MKEPSLKASTQLQSVMKDYSDLLQKNDDSDKSLINDFKQDILDQGGKPKPSDGDKSAVPESRAPRKDVTANSQTLPAVPVS
ncbi:hypothetical protein MZG94_23160, partial [Escherichia coli]|nr:hypothetical protein [Escherichia coli]